MQAGKGRPIQSTVKEKLFNIFVCIFLFDLFINILDDRIIKSVIHAPSLSLNFCFGAVHKIWNYDFFLKLANN